MRLDERADHVVVLVAVAVVADRGPVDRASPASARSIVGRPSAQRRAGGGLEVGQRPAGVAAGQPDQVVGGVLVER